VKGQAVDAEFVGAAKLNRGGVAWAVFDVGLISYSGLITVFVFMPYVATIMVGDPVRGQELVSRFQQYGGWAVMVTAPFLGASIDNLGPRKPWLAAALVCIVSLLFSLWWAKPDQSGLSTTATMTIVMALTVLITYADVLRNSMLVRAAGLRGAPRASGLGIAVGSAASLLTFAFTTWAFALPGKLHASWVPTAPLLGLDAASHQTERVAPILAAVLLGLGAIPLFLFTPDAPRTGLPKRRALVQGAAELWDILRTAARHKDAFVYLASRMLFFDGISGMILFFGVIAAGVFKWGPLELLLTGVMVGVVSVFGGLVGRWLDQGVGPVNALRIEVFVVILGISVAIGTKPDRIFYFWSNGAAYAPLWNGPVFRTLPDLILLLMGAFNGLFVAAINASSRSALVGLAPPALTGAFFGVSALSGVATAWLAPSLINIGTQLTHTQQGGLAAVLCLVILGLIGLFFVRGGDGATRGVSSIPSRLAKHLQ
jgi:UMF1 family MFS transporter